MYNVHWIGQVLLLCFFTTIYLLVEKLLIKSLLLLLLLLSLVLLLSQCSNVKSKEPWITCQSLQNTANQLTYYVLID